MTRAPRSAAISAAVRPAAPEPTPIGLASENLIAAIGERVAIETDDGRSRIGTLVAVSKFLGENRSVLRDKLKALLAWVQQQQPEVDGKICVDSSPMMDKAWAVRAGIGWLGKHSNVITKEFGSWVFLGELLLSVELEYDSFIEPDHCGTCTACIDACPTGAIIAPYQVDGTRCISYGTIELREPELPEPIKSNLEGWVFGCDICQDVCPWSRFSKKSGEERFTPREGIAEPKLQELIEMSQEEFSARFRNSPIKRTKLAGLKRNAETAQQNSPAKI